MAGVPKASTGRDSNHTVRIACDRELKFDPERLNVNGGGVSLGHPTGCSGTRILVALAHELQRTSGRYGIATLCVSGGQGMAVLLERV